MAKKKKAAPRAAKTKKAAPKKSPAKKAAKRGPAILTKAASSLTTTRRKHRIYIEACAFFPANSSDGYVDHFQDGRRSAVPNRALLTPIVLPVGCTLVAMTIHYTNSTDSAPIAFFLRKHRDRHSPSGEIEMSFINLNPGVLPPDNYLSVTDTSFPDGGVIQDKFLHYLEVSGTGDYGSDGRVTVRGVSLDYVY